MEERELENYGGGRKTYTIVKGQREERLPLSKKRRKQRGEVTSKSGNHGLARIKKRRIEKPLVDRHRSRWNDMFISWHEQKRRIDG